MKLSTRNLLLVATAIIALSTSCAQPSSGRAPRTSADQTGSSQPRKTLVVGITTAVEAMPIMGVPATQAAIGQMESAEAPDDGTLVLYWKGPYYLAASIGSQAFWPLPRHILEQPYRTLERQGFFNLSYWTSGFIHLGPFRLAEFHPGEELIFAAYDGYFLGRPRVDRVVVRTYGDANTLYAATIAGAVDILMDTSLTGDKAIELKEAWDRSGDGTVHVGPGITYFISPQFDPSLQRQPSILDSRTRRALMHATDRASLSDVANAGRRDLVANALVAAGERLHEPVRDGFAHFTFDPARASALLSEVGWSRGGDGILVDSGGRRFETTLAATPASMRQIAVIADDWKQIGIVAEQQETPAALARDLQYRQSYPGLELSSSGSGDAILTRIDGRELAAPPSYAGVNRGHYLNPNLDVLIDTYRRTIDERAQGQALRAISDVVAEELPVLPMFFDAMRPAVRKGVKAFDDFAGGAEPGQLYGTFSRNAHEWDKL